MLCSSDSNRSDMDWRTKVTIYDIGVRASNLTRSPISDVAKSCNTYFSRS